MVSSKIIVEFSILSYGVVEFSIVSCIVASRRVVLGARLEFRVASCYNFTLLYLKKARQRNLQTNKQKMVYTAAGWERYQHVYRIAILDNKTDALSQVEPK